MQSHEAAHSAQQIAHVTADHAAVAHGGHHEAHELPNIITFLNESFAESPLVSFLHRWENLVFSLIAAGIFIFLFIKASKKESLIPAGLRNFIEVIVEAFENFVVGIMGEAGRKHVPFIGTLFIYILMMNWSGLIPFAKSSTASWSTTIALAVIATAYIQISGIRALGFGHYLHHIAGSPAGLIPWAIGILLIFPLNLVLELGAVPFSLSLRLFANISSEDRLLFKFAELGFKALPLQFFGTILAVMFSIIQAFVFTLLTTVYISILMPHEAHEEAHAAKH